MDARMFMRKLQPEIADIVFLDPPFNLGKDYDIPSSLETATSAEYLSYMNDVLSESVRVLKQGGSLFLYHLPYWASRFTAVLHDHLTFRHWIAISMKNGFVRGQNLYPAHYALLYFTKGNPNTFNRPRLHPRKCRHCDEYVKDYGGYIDIIQEKGINLSDIWDDLSPVRHKSTKLRAANQLPIQLTDRVVHIAGKAGDLLIDPFVGSGTSVISAVKYGMRFVANDLSENSISLSTKRLLEQDREELASLHHHPTAVLGNTP